MSKVAPIKAPLSAGGDFELPEEGVYTARCYKMVDVGTQTTTGQYGTKEQRQVYIYWELLTDDDDEPVFMEDGKTVFSIFNSYTLSMNQKANLRKHLDAWRGKKFTEEEAAEFDITKLLGTYCKIQITHTTSKDGQKTYANVNTIMATKKRPEGVNELIAFSIENPDAEVFESLPQWLQDKIESAPEWNDDGEATATDEPAGQPAAEKPQLADDEIDIKDVQF